MKYANTGGIAKTPSSTCRLQPGFTPPGIWAFSIGTSIGWGSFIVTCSAYLQKAGVLGTVFGLLAGAAVIMVIIHNLQYMIKSAPEAGGIYSFEQKVGGKDLGFVAGWFVALTYFAILWANITSVPLFARFFIGDTFRFGFHYNIYGYEVWMGEALLSIVAVLIIGFLCLRSTKLINGIMVGAALLFVFGFTVCAVVAVIRHDGTFSYSPNYIEGTDSIAQIVRIAVISPWAFIGFENVSHFSEEYKFPIKKVRSILIWSVVVTTALYILVSLLSISAYPSEYENWLEYIRDMGNLSGLKAVPAFYAADYYLGKAGVIILLFALFGVIFTSLIGNMMALSRLLLAVSRNGEAPKALTKLNKRGAPLNVIYAIVAISVFIPFLGRTAIGWIVDVTTLGATLIYGLISYAVFRHSKENNRKAEQITGVLGFILMGCFLLMLLIPGLLPFHAMETESYILFIVWAVIGLFYFRILVKRSSVGNYGKRIIVWLILLVMIMFASMMWVSRATENAANEAVNQIYSYHQLHPDCNDNEEREAFLKQQAHQVSKTNKLYTIVSLGLFVISMSVMFGNYLDAKKLNDRLADAEAEARFDALTGVRNHHAYLKAEEALERRIADNQNPEFAVVVFDINDLKKVNDIQGHQAGDALICKACKIICDTFKHSPVFRIGGDEFAVISQGVDYERIEELTREINDQSYKAKCNGGVVIACGMSRYENDCCAAAVFERADRNMYNNKNRLKNS